jgi:hypothetical protein
VLASKRADIPAYFMSLCGQEESVVRVESNRLSHFEQGFLRSKVRAGRL